MLSLVELVPAVKQLLHAEKLRLMPLPVIDLAQGEDAPLVSAESDYPVWTPLAATGAAKTLWQVLNTQKAGS